MDNIEYGGYGAVGQRVGLWFRMSWVRVPLSTLTFLAKTPVEGAGIEYVDDSFVFEYDNMQIFDEDIMIGYKVKKK